METIENFVKALWLYNHYIKHYQKENLMSAILLPIKKKYSQMILNKTKLFELRRRVPKRQVNKIYIYETSPTMKIVGWFEVKRTHENTIEDLYNKTKHGVSGTKEHFLEYYIGREIGYAYEIGKVKRYENPISLSEVGLSFAPQGFIYADHFKI